VLIRALAVIPMAALLGATPYLMQQGGPQQSSSQEAAEFSVPPNIAAEANPVHPTPEAMAMAKKMYGYDCAMCHGADGGGKGNMAASLKTPMKDWRDPATLKGLTDGELFYMIKKGHGDMPPEGGRQSDDGIWNLVTVVRSFAKK
jgi:mono/diheme cytochrome c family protein